LNEKIDSATAKVATAHLKSPLPMAEISEEEAEKEEAKGKVVRL